MKMYVTRAIWAILFIVLHSAHIGGTYYRQKQDSLKGISCLLIKDAKEFNNMNRMNLLNAKEFY